mmetsp:Transcript_28240/g.45459  ORF Transcript_28240/g.45459 Transcript_28240/m.45459 type:complete len:83 (-) Transcript_28240:4868-5116(-)
MLRGYTHDEERTRRICERFGVQVNRIVGNPEVNIRNPCFHQRTQQYYGPKGSRGNTDKQKGQVVGTVIRVWNSSEFFLDLYA